MRIAAEEQQRRHGRPPRSRSASQQLKPIEAARDQLGVTAQFGHSLRHIHALIQADERSHADAFNPRIAHGVIFPKAVRRGGGQTSSTIGAGTSALRMAVHFWPALDRHLANHFPE